MSTVHGVSQGQGEGQWVGSMQTGGGAEILGHALHLAVGSTGDIQGLCSVVIFGARAYPTYCSNWRGLVHSFRL